MITWTPIRRLYSRGNKSERQIARITGLSSNTVSKWLHGQVDGPPKHQRGEQPTKLTAFHEALRQALTVDARRPRQQRRTARALYTEIKAAGYEGGYSRVTDFIRAWRQGQGQGAATNAFIPLAFALGEACQFCQWHSNNPQLWHLKFPHPSTTRRSERWKRKS
ncbi:transposase, partial [Pseudacidovorax sp. 1753]